MVMFDWNDLKAFLAVARGGSTLAASKAMGVNQTTVSRRIEALETELGFRLFERGQTGSRLTEAGHGLVADAEAVEQAAIRFANHAAGQLRDSSGALRLTTNELLASTMVIPALAEFRKAHPHMQVDLIVTDRSLDLEHGEADLAIRTARALAPSNLVARTIAAHDTALYCSREYAARRGVPATPDELCHHDLIDVSFDVGEMPAASWMMRHAGGKPPITRSNSMASLLHAVKAGLGIGVVPCAIGDPDPDLIRCSECIEEGRSSSWIVIAREMRETPRVRAFIDFVAPYLQQQLRIIDARGRAQLEADAATVVPFPTKASSAG